VRARIIIFIAAVQSILFAAHWLVYETWTHFWGTPDPGAPSTPQIVLAVLSVSFVTASLLAFRYSHFLVSWLYKLAAVWLGTLSFLVWASCSCWGVYAVLFLLGRHSGHRTLVGLLFGLAILASAYGMANAHHIRMKRLTVKLANLPPAWRGRTAALVSDVHLGHVRGHGFARKIATMIERAQPDVVFIAGDLYDGGAADLDRLAQPWEQLSAPLGAYFVPGNHEEFSDPGRYFDALGRSGIRVLDGAAVTVDGLQIVGVRYRDTGNSERFRAVLQRAGLRRDLPSVLLSHTPRRLPIAEQEGISLQLSGHTHGGQFFPFMWVVSRVYGKYGFGLNHYGRMTIYTSNGAGTWGPPLRIGANPEIALIRFE
jgi:uncharacterized protein